MADKHNSNNILQIFRQGLTEAMLIKTNYSISEILGIVNEVWFQVGMSLEDPKIKFLWQIVEEFQLKLKTDIRWGNWGRREVIRLFNDITNINIRAESNRRESEKRLKKAINEFFDEKCH